MSIWNKLFGNSPRQMFLKRIKEANIYERGLIRSTYGYSGYNQYRTAAARGPILESDSGSSRKLLNWIDKKLNEGGSDAKQGFKISMENNHINFTQDRMGRGCFAGPLTDEGYIWVVRIGRDDYEWILWEFIAIDD
jgi:hypothetical protein